MRFQIFTFLLLALFLTACASSGLAPQQNKTEKSQLKASASPVNLEKMDIPFLYLAAQDAINKRQYGLAIRFLQAIVKKEPEALEPRFELVELILSSVHGKVQAQTYMETIPDAAVAAMSATQYTQYQLLYARSLIANQQSEQAAKLLKSILQAQPQRVDVRLLLAKMYAINHQYALAHDTVDTGLKAHQDLRLQRLKVQLLLQQGKLAQADRLLKQMQATYPEHEDIVLQRAELAEKLGNSAKAERLLQQFIQTRENTALQSYHMLANIYERQNKFNQAIAIYQKLIPLTASDAEVLMSIGRLHYQMQAFDQAAGYFKQAVEQLTPQNKRSPVRDDLATASFYYGASLEALHQWKQAIPEYQRLTPKHRFYLDAQMRLASIDITYKQWDTAEKRLLELQAQYANNMAIYELLSGLRLQQERYRLLIQESDKALDLGFSRQLLFNRAVAFEKLKAFEQLDKTLDSILAQNPNDAEALNFYGYSLAERGIRLDEAQRMLEAALEIRPNDGYYLDSLAWIFFQKGGYSKALTYQLKAVQYIPDDALMMEHLGDIYWQLGHQHQAREAWEQSLKLGHEQAGRVEDKIENGLVSGE